MRRNPNANSSISGTLLGPRRVEVDDLSGQWQLPRAGTWHASAMGVRLQITGNAVVAHEEAYPSMPRFVGIQLSFRRPLRRSPVISPNGTTDRCPYNPIRRTVLAPASSLQIAESSAKSVTFDVVRRCLRSEKGDTQQLLLSAKGGFFRKYDISRPLLVRTAT